MIGCSGLISNCFLEAMYPRVEVSLKAWASMIGCSGLISNCFLAAMYPRVEVSLKAWAFMILSMLAVQPYWDVTIQHGEDTRRLETMTFSTLLSRISRMILQRPSKSVFNSSLRFFSSSSSGNSRPSLVTDTNDLPSYSFSCWTTYSSMGSVMYNTSNPLFLTLSTKAELETVSLLSPVM